MSKKRTGRKIIKIPGRNGSTHVKVPNLRVDPNVPPLGSAFDQEGAQKISDAVLDGIRQIMTAFNLRGYFVNFVIPVVEYKKDIPMPDGTKKDDFVLVNGTNPAFASVPTSPGLMQAAQLVTPILWKGAYGVDQNVEAAPANSPENLPDVPPAVEPA